MRLKKYSVIIALVLTIATIVTACTPPSSSNNTGSSTGTSSSGQKAKGEVLRVATMPNNIGAPLVYADEKGLFEEAGLNVEIVLFPTGAPINEALAAEQIDVAFTGLAGVYALASGEASWIGDIDVTLEGLNIYVRPDSPVLQYKGVVEGKPNVYGNAETVKGLTLLGPLGTSSQFNAIMWAETFGLTGNDINMLHMDFGPALQAFKAGEGDALPTSPPFHYQAEAEGFIPVADLGEVSGMDLSNGVVVRNKIKESRRDDVKKLLEIVYSVVDLFDEDEELLADFVYEFYNANAREYTREMVEREIIERDYVGRDYMSKPSYRFGSTMIGMGEFYVKDGKIDEADYPNILESMDPSFMEEIYGIDIKIFGEE